MNLFNKIIPIITLSPLILATYISILNLNVSTSLRILTWKTIDLPIGIWIFIASSSAALVSSATFVNVDRQQSFNRKVKIYPNDRNVTQPLYTDPDENNEVKFSQENEIKPLGEDQIPPQRDLKDPLPIISVPYRIIKGPNNIINNIEEQYNQNQYESEFETPSFEDELTYDDSENYTQPDWINDNNENW